MQAVSARYSPLHLDLKLTGEPLCSVPGSRPRNLLSRLRIDKSLFKVSNSIKPKSRQSFTWGHLDPTPSCHWHFQLFCPSPALESNFSFPFTQSTLENRARWQSLRDCKQPAVTRDTSCQSSIDSCLWAGEVSPLVKPRVHAPRDTKARVYLARGFETLVLTPPEKVISVRELSSQMERFPKLPPIATEIPTSERGDRDGAASPNKLEEGPASETSGSKAAGKDDCCADLYAREEPPSLLVFSGGTAFNGLVEDMKALTTRVAHVLPVSDDGGSTAEIVRVLGGPAIGDIRSRCLRLSAGGTAEAQAVKRLLGHRLPNSPSQAKAEWHEIVEGKNPLWDGVSEPYKDTIRAFLVHFQHQILQHASENFNFQNGSVGNFFFTGARSFFRSLDAAIFLFSRVAHLPPASRVLPAIRTNDRLTLGAELQDGTVIRGQHEISHPSVQESPSQHRHAVDKNSKAAPALSSPIKRIFYMASEGLHLLDEVFPTVNPTVVEEIRTVDAIIYGIGSLYTSICPSLVLRGVGEAIAERPCPKILLMNGTHDRETTGMSAADFVTAVADALDRRHGEDSVHRLRNPAAAYVTTVVSPRGGSVPIDRFRLERLGIADVVTVDSMRGEDGSVLYEPKALISALESILHSHLGTRFGTFYGSGI